MARGQSSPDPVERWGGYAVYRDVGGGPSQCSEYVRVAGPSGFEWRFAAGNRCGHYTADLRRIDLGPGPGGRPYLAVDVFHTRWEDGGGDSDSSVYDVLRRARLHIGLAVEERDEESPSVWGRWVAVAVYDGAAPRIQLRDLRRRLKPRTLAAPPPPSCLRRDGPPCFAHVPDLEMHGETIAFIRTTRPEGAGPIHELFVMKVQHRPRRIALTRGGQSPSDPNWNTRFDDLRLSSREVSVRHEGRRLHYRLDRG